MKISTKSRFAENIYDLAVVGKLIFTSKLRWSYKVFGVAIAILVTIGIMFSSLFGSNISEQDAKGSIYDFKVKSLEGDTIDFSMDKAIVDEL
jgi:hypothetical protein